jgi:hypothetical protein
MDSVASRWLPANGYTISGGTSYHYAAIAGGVIDANSTSMTVTVSGTPSFSGAFALAANGGQVIAYPTYSGAANASGIRWLARLNGVIDANQNANCVENTRLPGSTITGRRMQDWRPI